MNEEWDWPPPRGRLLTCIAAVGVCTAISFSASAQDQPSPIPFPQYDVDAACNAAWSQLQEPYRSKWANDCINDQQEAYNYLSAVWPDFTDQGKRMIVKLFGPTGSALGDATRYRTMADWAARLHEMPNLRAEEPQHKFQP